MKKILIALFGFIFISLPSVGFCEILVAKDPKKIMEVDTATIDGRRIKGSIMFDITVNYSKPYAIDEFFSKESRVEVVTDCSTQSLRVLRNIALLMKNDTSKTQAYMEDNITLDSWDTPYSTKALITKTCAAAVKEGLFTPVKTYASVKDFPVGQEIETSKFNKSLVAEICKNISGVDNNIAPTVLTMAGPMANSGALAQIYRNGGGRWDGMFISGDTCVADFVINGSYNGTSYSARMSCPINKVRRNNPKNTKLDLIWVDSFSCRKVG